MKKFPEAARSAVEASLSQAVPAWRQEASTEAGMQVLRGGCRAALEAARKAMAAYQCEW
jgi:predicted TIM-barrel enzyme